MLLFPQVSPQLTSTDNDVFGGKINPETNLANDAEPHQGTIFAFWHKESGADQVEQNLWDVEELHLTREIQELADECDKAMRKFYQSAGDHEKTVQKLCPN